jgi:hypothetical protein
VTRRYFLLFLAVLALGLALGFATRSGRLGPRASRTSEAAPVPRVTVSLTVHDTTVTPADLVVPLGSRVSLEIANEGRKEVDVALAGYAGRLPAIRVQPGAVGHGEFTADLPGEDFAWLVNGRPASRLTVAGSHLIEGHR